MQIITALLALVAATGAVGLVVLRIIAVRSEAARRWGVRINQARIPLAALVGVTATLGSLYFSEFADMVPCRLCWFQRVLMYPIAIVGVIATIRRDRGARWYLLAFSLIGIGVSIYHYTIEWNPDLETGSCGLFGGCAAIWFREFGFVTLSFMALCGFAAVIALTTVNFPADTSTGSSDISSAIEPPPPQEIS